MAIDGGRRHGMGRIARLVVFALLGAGLTGGCGAEAAPTDVEIRGSIFTDMLDDRPCDVAQAPPELARIAVHLLDEGGTVIATTGLGPLTPEPLPPRPGTEAWQHHGCRYHAPYAVRVPVAATYTVDFTVPPPPAQGSYWNGGDALERQTLTHADLEARDFTWSFEAPAQYVAS